MKSALIVSSLIVSEVWNSFQLQEERDWLLKTFSTAPFSTAPAPVRVIVSSPLSSGPSSSPVVE